MITTRSLFKKKKGFSLIEVLVGLGLFSVLSLMITQMILNMNVDIKKSESKFSELALTNQLSQIISDKALCKNALDAVGSRQIFTGSLFRDIKLSLPSGQIISKNTKYGTELIIKEFYIKDLQAPTSLGSDLMKVMGNLYLKTEDVSTKSVPRKEKNIGILQIVYSSLSKEIVECFGSVNDPQVACESLGFIWNSAQNKCKQAPSQACTDFGGNWDGTKCSATQVASNLSILNKSCAPNQFLYGFDSNGDPKCQTNTNTTSTSSSNITTSVSSTTAKGKCNSGYADEYSPDGSNKCHFEWNETTAGVEISTQSGSMSATNGGTARATCRDDRQYNYTFSCPNKTSATCVGGQHTKDSVDRSNTCDFVWLPASSGQDIIVTQATNGGTLTGKCNSDGAWTYSFHCPGKTTSCPGGEIRNVGKCNFVYDSTPVGQPAKNLRDTNGKGIASGWICQENGTYTKGIYSGCD